MPNNGFPRFHVGVAHREWVGILFYDRKGHACQALFEVQDGYWEVSELRTRELIYWPGDLLGLSDG